MMERVVNMMTMLAAARIQKRKRTTPKTTTVRTEIATLAVAPLLCIFLSSLSLPAATFFSQMKMTKTMRKRRCWRKKRRCWRRRRTSCSRRGRSPKTKEKAIDWPTKLWWFRKKILFVANVFRLCTWLKTLRWVFYYYGNPNITMSFILLRVSLVCIGDSLIYLCVLFCV